MANNTDTIRRLPSVFQTVTERKFFDATFDQVFSKRDADRLTGFIGRRVGGEFDPINDFYLPEPDKDRTWYQLEPTAYSTNIDTLEKTNQFFYKDMIDRIRFYGGDVENHDRLFNGEYYSYSPPIDVDKFVNFQNYFWLPNRLSDIIISGMTDTDVETLVLGQANFNTTQVVAASPQDIEFTSGLRVRFQGSASYNRIYTVENVGDAILLVADQTEIQIQEDPANLPWDSSFPNDPSSDNTRWDSQPFDSINTANFNPDYVTMQRGALDLNAWSRTNKWYHIDVINQAISAGAGQGFPDNAVRAQRPIIEFFRDIELFRSGTNFLTEVEYFAQVVNKDDNGNGNSITCCDVNSLQFNTVQGQPLADVQALPIFSEGPVSAGTRIVFPCDFSTLSIPSGWDNQDPTPTGELDETFSPILRGNWDGLEWDYDQVLDDEGNPLTVRQFVWQITIVDDGGTDTVVLVPYKEGEVVDPLMPQNAAINEGDIILINNGPRNNVYNHFGETHFFTADVGTPSDNATWEPGLWVLAESQKTADTPFPKFNLYALDSLGGETYVPLDDDVLFPGSNFGGSEIFSYKLSTDPEAVIDGVLGLPIVFESLGQLSDIVFENDLQTERYSYVVDNNLVSIPGYYYYRTTSLTDDEADQTTWQLDNGWYQTEAESRQRVIDRYAAFRTDSTQIDYILSLAPLNDDAANMEVFVNSEPTTNFQFLYVNGEPTLRLINGVNSDEPEAQDIVQNDVIEAFTYTYGRLQEEDLGYFEIPQQIEANPTNLEVFDQSFSDLTPHFTTIIGNQIGVTGNSLGKNTYRDTLQDPSLGTFILQNQASLLRTMFASSTDDVDVIPAIRFAQNEYVNFKARFLKIATQRDIAGFSPLVGENEIFIDLWLEEILAVLSATREFSDSFAFSYMIGRSDVFRTEETTVDFNNPSFFDVDLSDPTNVLYLYKIVDTDNNDIYEQAELLLVDRDYIVTGTELGTEITFLPSDILSFGDEIIGRIYEDSPPAFIPATPAKLGMAPAVQPRFELDDSYVTPIFVLVGHDGSKTPTFGDITFDAENIPTSTDIRDLLLYELEKRIYNGINPKFNRDPNTLLRIEDIRPGYFRQLDTVNNEIIETDINRYTRDEFYKITESFFSKWSAENRADYRINEFYNSAEWRTWNYSTQVDPLTGENLPGHWKGIFEWLYDTCDPADAPWEMLGFSREPDWWEATPDTGDGFNGYGPGPYPSTDPLWADLEAGLVRRGTRAGVNEEFVRPGLSTVLPVDGAGAIRPIADIFGLDPLGQWDGVDGPWVYGDGAPVERAWYESSEYYFSQLEFYYLMRPAEFGEFFWAPADLDFRGDQLLDLLTNERLKNETQTVHGETVSGSVVYRTGYQQYISDRLFFLSKNITDNFGNLVRNLDINLGYKTASFTNQDTLRFRLSSSSTGSSTGNLLVPTNNYQTFLYTGSSIRDYTYSGVIVRANADGTFTVYGYDLLCQTFKVLPARDTSRAIQVNQGGTPAAFREFEFGETYSAGDIVRYRTQFYQANVSHTADTFVSANWTRLNALPEVGGITVTYFPDRVDEPEIVPYATILPDAQAVFDFLIGYGAFLESEGFNFERSNDLNQILNWRLAGDQFLFWVVNEWAPDNALFLSPGADAVTLEVETGYPANVEKLSNGVYSILDKRGVSINPQDTLINRQDRFIQVVPNDLGTGVYYLRVSAKETEHIVLFDNITEFNDTVYDPLLRVRQDRLQFTGTKTNNWFGKLEAPGFLVQDNTLIQNFDNLAESIRRYYDTETALDNPEIEAGARHLIGQENREFLDELEISDDVQFNFYQGFIRQKGTANAVDKLLRSDAITGKDDISFTEEWAFKIADFGGTDENITIEFVSNFDEVRSDPQTYRLNYVRSGTGSVRDIVIYNAEDFYASVPGITVVPANGETPTVEATATATLNSNNRLESITVTNAGEGYTGAPDIVIEDTRVDTSNPQTDFAYSVFQPDVVQDLSTDAIVEVDIDDTDKWVLRPRGVDARFAVPTTEKNWLDYTAPNAGYVHLDDVNRTAFNTEAVFSLPDIEPLGFEDTIWVAVNKQEDWGVYILFSGAASNIRSSADGFGNNQFDNNPWDSETGGTGDMVLLDIDNSFFIGDSEELPRRYLDHEFSGSFNDSGIIVIETPDLNEVYRYSYDSDLGVWFLQNQDGTPVSWDETFAPTDTSFINAYTPFNLRFRTQSERVKYNFDRNYLSWVDDVDGLWRVEFLGDGIQAWDTLAWDSGTEGFDTGTTLFRQQNVLVDTSLYENAFIRDIRTADTLSRLPVYDPFKDILAGPADQNIDFKSARDPARYTNASDERLINPSRTFGEAQVGMIWWDYTNTRFLYYEQPPIFPQRNDFTERTNNLLYRRDNWGRLFPGSSADVYEWVKSPVPPAQYNGDGTPRNTTDFVQIDEFDTFNRITTTNYYFWVTDKTEKPSNIPNRTLTTIEIERLISNPRALGYSWFSPIQLTEQTNSVTFANVDNILSNRNAVLQVNYKLREDANVAHDQWQLIGEGDRFSEIPDYLWNKTIDSLVGYTDVLPADEYSQGVPVSDTEVVLPVPSPTLSENEKYGIRIRPQQSLFVDVNGARKVMAQKINSIMNDIQLWNARFLNWNEDLTGYDPLDPFAGGTYWQFVDWFEDGYDATNTTAKLQVENLTELLALAGTIPDGTLVRVFPTVPDVNDVFEIYEYAASDETFTLVRRQNGTINFLDTVYTDQNNVTLYREIRELLTALRDNVFISELEINENFFFFSMVNYALSEQKDVDWVFKTTYIRFLQDNVLLEQRPNFEPDLLDEFLSYVEEAKPYHTKLRDATTVLVSTEDLAPGTAFDDAIGERICVPLDTPIVDPINPDQEITESCYWDDDSITENLRLFNIRLNYSRVWCSEEERDEYLSTFTEQFDSEPWDTTAFDGDLAASTGPSYLLDTQAGDCSRLAISGGAFLLGWDTVPSDGNITIFGFDEITGVPSGYESTVTPQGIVWTQVSNGLGELLYGWDLNTFNGSIGDFLFSETDPDLLVDASAFGSAGETPEEQILLAPVEDVVISLDYIATASVGWDNQDTTDSGFTDDNSDPILLGNWDGDLWDATTGAPTDIGYRLHKTPFGTFEYSRTCDAASTTLEEDLTPLSTTIDVADASVLAVPDVGEPGVIWINAERIEYWIISGDTLIDIRRGTNGTRIASHPQGSRVNDGSELQAIQDPNDVAALPTNQTFVNTGGDRVPLTDPWFSADVAGSGEVQVDANGDIVLFARTAQASFLLDCPGTTSNLTYLYDELYGADTVFNLYDAVLPNQINKPVVMFVHGGGWFTGDKQIGPQFDSKIMQQYARLGYPTVNINYELGVHDLGVQDIIEAKNFMAATYGQPVIMMGFSAGGHLATLASQLDPTDVSGVVSFYGVYDFDTLDPATLGGAFAAAYQGAFPSSAVSPTLNPLPGTVEYLILHGTDDIIVDVSQAQLMAATFPQIEYIEIEGENHTFFPNKYPEVLEFVRSIT
jgi:acetyl esterase/lipase